MASFIRDERCERRREHRNGLQTGVKRLIGRQFVLVHAAAPETLAVEAYVPVGEVFAHELLNGARRRRRVVQTFGRVKGHQGDF